MPGVRYAEVWDRIVTKHKLQKLSLDDLVGDSWEFTDNSFGGWGVVEQRSAVMARDSAGSSSDEQPPSELKIGVLLSMIKLMKAGASETEGLLIALLCVYREPSG